MAPISIRSVRKNYGKTPVVHGVDLEIANGEFVVILGPSGCGKSTLLRMIAGLEDITSGEIAIDGRVVNRLEPRERGCAMVFQNYALYPHMTVAENIGYALKVAGVPKAERLERVQAVARTIGLEDFLERKPGQLSGGQRQRVAMGRAMIREPKVFLFDEPLSNLDAKLRVQMRIEIRRLHQRLGATSIFVTHDQVEAMTLADKLIVMNAGRVEQVGAPRDVYHKPASHFVGGFIGSPAMNFLKASIVRQGVAVTSNGRELPFDDAQFDAPVGTAVEIGIRPEDVLIVDGSVPDAIALPVEFAEELGAGKLYHAFLDGQDFVVFIAGDHAPIGAALKVQISRHATHVFDAQTGQRRERGLSAPQANARVVAA